MYLFEVHLIHVFTNNLDEFLVTLELDGINSYLVHLVDDTRIVRSQYLCTIVPIGLVTIVFARIMAGRDIHTGLTTQFTDSKGYLGRGTQVVEQIDLDAVGREDVGRNFSKLTAVVTAVVSYDNRDLLQIGKVLVQVVGHALCSSAYSIDVHAVAARAHNAAQSARTKLEVLVEALNKFSLVLILQHTFHFGLGFRIKSGTQP